MSSPKAPRKRKRPAAQNQRAQGSRPRWRQGAADKDNDDDGARSSDRPRSSPTGGRLLRCRRWTVVCPPRLAVASGPFHAAIVDLNIRARRLSQRPEVRIGRRYRNAIVTERGLTESNQSIIVELPTPADRLGSAQCRSILISKNRSHHSNSG